MRHLRKEDNKSEALAWKLTLRSFVPVKERPELRNDTFT